MSGKKEQAMKSFRKELWFELPKRRQMVKEAIGSGNLFSIFRFPLLKK
jgi:hypothetical protein